MTSLRSLGLTSTKVPRTTKRARAIMASAHTMTSYTLDNGFVGHAVEPQYIDGILRRYWFDPGNQHHAYVRDNGGGRFTLHVHGNLWFDFSAEV
jgi:hypothetical protein